MTLKDSEIVVAFGSDAAIMGGVGKVFICFWPVFRVWTETPGKDGVCRNGRIRIDSLGDCRRSADCRRDFTLGFVYSGLHRRIGGCAMGV